MIARPLPTVAVVIPCKNDARSLVRALESLTRQIDPADEVIVVDDASDQPVELGPLPRPFGLRLLRRDVSQGVGPARNDGIAAATSDVVAFLDADDEFMPGRIAALRPAFDHCDAVYSGVWVIGRQGKDIRLQDPPPPTDRLLEQLLLRPFLTTSSVAVRRALLQGSSGFPPRELASTFEDLVLWLELARSTRWCKLEEPLVRYHLGEPTWRKRKADLAGWHQGLERALITAAGADRRLERIARATAAYMASKRALQEGDRRSSFRYLLRSLAAKKARRAVLPFSAVLMLDLLTAGFVTSRPSVRSKVFWEFD